MTCACAKTLQIKNKDLVIIMLFCTQMAADIINCAFKTEFCMFKVNKPQFSVIMAITSHPVGLGLNRTNLGFPLQGPPHYADLRRSANWYKTPA